MKYLVFYGIDMAGAFAEDNAPIVIDVASEKIASRYAYDRAIEEAESMGGVCGFPHFSDEPMEDEADEENRVEWDEIENYIQYHVEAWTPELEKKYLDQYGKLEYDL